MGLKFSSFSFTDNLDKQHLELSTQIEYEKTKNKSLIINISNLEQAILNKELEYNKLEIYNKKLQNIKEEISNDNLDLININKKLSNNNEKLNNNNKELKNENENLIKDKLDFQKNEKNRLKEIIDNNIKNKNIIIKKILDNNSTLVEDYYKEQIIINIYDIILNNIKDAILK